MQKIFLAFLLGSFGQAALASHAEAKHRYCNYNPDDPVCSGENDEDEFYPQSDRYDDEDEYDGGEYIAPRERFRPRHAVNSCERVGRWLRAQGYRRVRATDCQGTNYKYVAWRSGQRVIVKVDKNRLRIRSVFSY